MADQVDQSFVKVHFHKMNVEYANWLVNKVLVKEADMASMRKQFLKDNQDKHKDNNYEFKSRDKDDKVPTTDGINEQPKEKRLKKKMILLFVFVFEHVYFKCWCETLRFRNYLGPSGLGFCLRFYLFRVWLFRVGFF